MRQNPKQIISCLKQYFKHLFFQKKPRAEVLADADEEEESNSYIPLIREIMEFILNKRSISYRDFAPVLLDGGDAEAVLLAANLLGPDLNRLTILTDRPAYFTSYTDTMYEEHGLIVEVFPKTLQKMTEFFAGASSGTVILDFEKTRERTGTVKFGKLIYLPIYKKRWESAGNLDIAVPIGYNTMIVRVSETVKTQPYLDKFENAFYENE